ncbi:MAG TPA: MBOAT family O-acyltransferase [Caldimonas sp.]|nr:MBOAT family O-acyltransferase [Caldimonas sp.]
MLFTSLEFLVFLPLALALYAALPPRYRWLALLAASHVFYGASKPANLLYLGGMTLVVLACGRALESAASETARRWILAAGLAAALGSLVAFKFYDFIAGELQRGAGIALPRLGLTAPAGYSFYAFSAASYLVDAFRRALPQAGHAGHVALYLAHFPKILAGPIERATTFLPQAVAAVSASPEQLVLGSQLFLWGLVKKVLIADNLAPLVDRTFAIAAYATPVDLALSVYFFAFQIYCDFSGYTDMAIGVSLLFGLKLMDNFRRPYHSRSPAEFWSDRWHISLAHWFRDYLYIPLGGSRVGQLRHYLNVMAVFIVSGMWHAGLGYGVGWTFLAWGILNGAYVWAGLASAPMWKRLGEKLPRVAASQAFAVLRVLLTFHLIAASWIFFRARSLEDAWHVIRKLATSAAEIPPLLAKYPFTPDHYTAFVLIVALVAIEIADERRSIFERLAAAPVALRWATCYLAIFALLLFGRWQAHEFIYMQF